MQGYATIPQHAAGRVGGRLAREQAFTMNERSSSIIATLIEKWHDLQVVGKLFFDPQVPVALKVIPIVALLYLISPIDVIPDVLLGPGQLDDAAVVLFALSLFLRLVPQERVEAARATVGARREEDDIEVKVERNE